MTFKEVIAGKPDENDDFSIPLAVWYSKETAFRDAIMGKAIDFPQDFDPVWQGECGLLVSIGSDIEAMKKAALEMCEWLFEQFNIGGMQTSCHVRSMSVGDVVTFGETSYRCKAMGWEVI